jgi:membrane protein implicated in regulation of membrane protease activity
VATGRAPVSGGFAIVCGLLFVTAVVLALTTSLSWLTVASTLLTLMMSVFSWRRFQRNDREYQQRSERLDQELGREP